MQNPDQRLPTSYFLVRNGLLYHKYQIPGSTCRPYGGPQVKNPAHTQPLCGYLGGQEHHGKVKRPVPLTQNGHRNLGFLPTVPVHSPTEALTRPLIPLRIIGIPFERIDMDLIGPLPKSPWGHEYIMVIMDYATRYP